MTRSTGCFPSRPEDQGGHLRRALVAEIGKIRRQVEAAIGHHQVLDTVEIAAEGEIVDALLARAALPVQVKHDCRSARSLAHRDMANCARIRVEDKVLLDLAHAGIDIFRRHPALGNLVAPVDVAQFAIVDDPVSAAVAVRQFRRIGEKIVFVGFERQ